MATEKRSEPSLRDLLGMSVADFGKKEIEKTHRFISRNGHMLPEDAYDIFFEQGRTDLTGTAIFQPDSIGRLYMKGLGIPVAYSHGDLTNVTLSAPGQMETHIRKFSAIMGTIKLDRSKILPLGERYIQPIQINAWNGKKFEELPGATEAISFAEKNLQFVKLSMPQEVIDETKDRLSGAKVEYYGLPIKRAREIGRTLDIGLLRETSPADYGEEPTPSSVLDFFKIRGLGDAFSSNPANGPVRKALVEVKAGLFSIRSSRIFDTKRRKPE